MPLLRSIRAVAKRGFHFALVLVLVVVLDVQIPRTRTRTRTTAGKVKRTKNRAVIASSNGSIDQFDKRFQSRFQPWVFEAPGFDEIAGFLADRFGAEREKAEEIAFTCGGDVRAACNDLQSWFDVQRAGREIASLAA